MKRAFKGLALIIMVAIFVTLIVLPVNLNSDILLAGNKRVINEIDTCVCPMGNANCQCLIIVFEKP